VTLVGRLPELSGAAGPLLSPPWLLIRLESPLELEGWVDLSDACFLFWYAHFRQNGEHDSDVCDYAQSGYPDWLEGTHLDELMAIPPVERPMSTDGLPDLEVLLDPAGVGDPCFPDVVVVVRNQGTAAAPRVFEVSYEGDDRGVEGYRHLGTTVTVELYRTLEPGESLRLEGLSWESVVHVDPTDQIDEIDEDNNRRQAPPDPGLQCQTVIAP
jgi:hypothetical protein